MKVGPYNVSVHNHGFFRLDGGAMFGVIPKNLWARQAPPDEQNRILLATRSLIIVDGERKILVDLGCGDKWSEKGREIYDIADRAYEPVPDVTDVFMTHLHFDHCGGISRMKDGHVEPCYPKARHFAPAANYEYARNANVREKASYLSENLEALSMVDLHLTVDGQVPWPGVQILQANGHTRGLQWLRLSDGTTTIAYPTDLCPTPAHLPVTHALGYDMCAETSIAEKQSFVTQAVEGKWIVVFEHDPEVAAGRVEFDNRGRAKLAERIEF